MSFSLAFILLEWAIRLVMLPVVVTRKAKPATALSWLVLIYFLPLGGLFLYLLVGENRLGIRRIREHSPHAAVLRLAARKSAALTQHIIHPHVKDDQLILSHLAESLGGLPILGGNAVSLIAETDRVIDLLVQDINAATQHVHLLFYIIMPDVTGRRVTDALIAASGRGVACRVLADAVGSRHYLRTLGHQLKSHNINIRAILPANPIRRRFARLDLRNHRKLAIIDGLIAYTGSQNIADANYGTKRFRWRDLMARIVGPSVAQLQAVFIEDWDFATRQPLSDHSLFPAPRVDGDVAMQTVPSGPNFPTAVLQDVVVEAIHAARRRVIITSPYFVPDESLVVAIRLAVVRGVRLDLVLPRRTNHPLVDLAGGFYVQELLSHGVRVHLHNQGLLHSKTLTVDDSLAMVGSANFDIRSFYLNFELNVLLYNADVTAQLRVIQNRYIAESAELTLDVCRARGPLSRLTGNCAKLLSPLL